jgi:hypothetical protein
MQFTWRSDGHVLPVTAATPAAACALRMGSTIKNSDELWKILTFIRSRYDSDPAYKYGVPASQQ